MKNDKIKIAAIAGYFPNKEGEANYSTQVFSNLIERYFSSVDLNIHAHLPLHEADKKYVNRVTGGSSRITRFFSALSLSKVVLRDRPDVVHYQGTHTSLYGGLTGEPLLLIMLIVRLMGGKNVITIHSLWTKRHLTEFCRIKNFNKLKSWIFKLYIYLYYRLLGILAHRINILMAGEASNIYHEYVADYRFNVSKTFVELHPCWMLDRQSMSSREYGRRSTTILAAGFVRPDKGLTDLVEAFALVKNQRSDILLRIVGEPQGSDGTEYAKHLSDKVEKLCLSESVTLKFDYLSDDAFDYEMDNSDIVVLPYTRAIGASGPMHHALSRGIKVVASAVDQNLGMHKLIKLYSNGNIEDLSRAIIDALDDDNFSAKSIEYVTANNWHTLSDSYLDIYRRLHFGEHMIFKP